MADPINAMVALAEAKELAKGQPISAELLSGQEALVDEALRAMKFSDVDEVKSRLELTIARIVKARKAALDHLAALAYDDQRALLDD